ncbi:hypothetical protein niasHT_031797 [Heterodera trifolii]|uniref:Segment polarity protein dishevelled n=1 Tax=Heterodera trifolii TaxID=157864 RepID=A0ABD2IJD4_9BILA
MDDRTEEIVPFCAANGTTKVYYHLDDSATPYMSEVPVPSDRITLGDFKAVFTRKGYRYFCRRWDDQLKSEVKAELVRDQQRLQRSPVTGLFELFLLSPALPSAKSGAVAPIAGAGGGGNADTLPRTRRKFGAAAASSELPSLHHHQHYHLSALALSSIGGAGGGGGSSCSSGELLVAHGGGQRVSMVTGETGPPSSGTNTIISKRAGEHLADLYNSTSEDPYTRTTTISSSGILLRQKPGVERSFASSTTDRPPNGGFGGRPKRRRGRHRRRPYVPSTISSASDESSSSLPRIEEVKLRLQDAPLGISVASQQDGSIFIYSIQSGSAAEKCGCLEIGDQIVQVESTKFEELDEKQALDMLRRLNGLKKTVTIYVARRRPLNVGGGGGSSSDKSDALSQFCETIQLDIGQWVESTKQPIVEPVLPFVDVPVGKSSPKTNGKSEPQQQQTVMKMMMPTEEKGTSDEEQAAYMDRRNGVGPRFVSAVQKAKSKEQQKALLMVNDPKMVPTEVNNNNKNNGNKNAVVAAEPIVLPPPLHSAKNNPPPLPSPCHATAPSVPVPLHAAMEPSVILRRMAHPRSGLDIRDRKWLKIPVPNSFIGDDMLDWLMSNVQGFRDRKCARAFASTVLLKGFIKHVVNVSAFNEKCYYIFDDSILAERLHILRRESRQQQQKLEATTTTTNNNNTSDNGGNGGANGAENKQKQQPESTTEITYMSSPSTPFVGAVPTTTTMMAQQMANKKGAGGDAPRPPPPPPQLVIVNNPKYAQTPLMLNSQPSATLAHANNGNLVPLRHFANKLPAWPISPIPRECQSPEATNEYASMVQGEINCGAQFEAKFDGFLVPTLVNKSPIFVNNNNGNSILVPPPLPQRQIKKVQN